ncbi:MAG: trypsin-like peptidase domain-containing protein [Chloroflexota bacterium]
MKKKIQLIVLSILLAMAFVSCQEEENGEPQSSEPQAETQAQETDFQPVASATFVTLESTVPVGTPTAEASETTEQAEATPTEESEAVAAVQPGNGDTTAAIAALEGTLQGIYQEVNPSVVHIQVLVEGGEGQLGQIPGFTPPQQGPQFGEGSGFVWDQEGHIVTNNHVIAGATNINVIFYDDFTVPAEVVGTDADSDLAVLRVDVPRDRLRPVQLADSSEVHVGELAVAIGNPFGQEGSLTVGFISALGRLLPVQAQTIGGASYNIPDVIQTDAAINPGNSGGVLLDDQGRVIGVTTAIISPARASAGVGFAIPTSIVANVVPSLIENGEYQHPYLGIRGTTLTPQVAEAMDLPANQRGALIGEVEEGGPADEAGLQGSDREVEIEGFPVQVGGDVIIAMNGEPVNSMDDLITQLARTGKVGDTATLTIIRDGEEQEVQLTLQARPEGAEPQFQEAQQAWMGILGGTLTPQIAEAMELPADQQGVLVGEVVGGSPAEEAGLQGSTTTAEINGQEVLVGGDVIVAVDDHPIPDMQTLQQFLAQYAPGDEITVTVMRDGEEVELNLTLRQAPR